MKLKLFILLLLGLTVQAQTPADKATSEGLFAEMETSKGKILLELTYDKTPVTVANFVTLAEGTNSHVTDPKLKGKPFYDGLKFHRVISDFMIQGGDPAGNGSGGPGYRFKDEITDLKHDAGGILSMANSGPATNGSQFFITHKPTPWLDGKHTVFGNVISGMDVVNAIAQNDLIKRVTIIRKGSAAQKFDAVSVLNNYFVAQAEEIRRQQAEQDAKKLQIEQAVKSKAANLASLKSKATKTKTGLQFSFLEKGKGAKPAAGSKIYVSYAGYLSDGTLFDSNIEAVAEQFGKLDQRRAAQKGYQPFEFEAGRKDGLIAGFIEALELMSYGDRLIAFIPSKLAYGERGAGNGLIPPNADIIFEVQILENPPSSK